MNLRHSKKASSLKVKPKRDGAFVLFILDPFLSGAGQRYNFDKDTSHLLMLELQARGYRVFYATPSQVFVSANEVSVRASPVEVLPVAPYFAFEEEESLPLSRFRLVWIRKDPPFDALYLYMTQLLSLVAGRTPVVNTPQALRDWNEKLIILRFPRWIPATLVSADKHELAAFTDEHPRAILKPLQGFAGQGVSLISIKHPEEMHEAINRATQGGTLPVMAQAFLEKVRLGEKRVFMVDGRPLGAFLKIPQEGALANPDHGARLDTTSLTSREKKICAEVGSFLKKENVFFAGLDLIDGQLTEINITSPGLLWEWNAVENKNHEKSIIDLVERKFLTR